MLALTLAVPAFALEESDVEAAVSSSSREAVTGNVLVWFLCAVGFLKVSQKIDSFMASIGVNVGRTGGSMLGEAMVAFKGVSLAAGMAGKVVGNFADRASSRAGAAASGSSGFLQGGLAGVVSRKITNDAVRTATQTTQKASSSTMSAAHQATERTVNAERQAASVVHQAKQTRSESASQKSQMGVTHQQVASSTRTVSVSSLRRESQHSVGLGGRIFTNSMLEGGRFANDVIGMVAAGDLHSTGSITGEFASQALSSYMGITAQGDAAPQISYSDVEIGGGRITGTEYSPEHPEGISFGMYHILLRWLPIPALTMTGGDGGQRGSRMKKCAQLRSLGRRSMPSSRSFSPCRNSKPCGRWSGCAGCMPNRQMSPRNLICTRKRRIFISGSA